jgi:hypothetical protein
VQKSKHEGFMSDLGAMSPVNMLLRATALELNSCQEQVEHPVLVPEDQTAMLGHLLDTLAQAETALNKEIGSGRFEKIDPAVLAEVETAIQRAIADPLDAKIKSVYLSIFGYNTSLWHMLRNIQKLLRTVHVQPRDTAGKRVMKVQKKNKELRKRRDE